MTSSLERGSVAFSPSTLPYSGRVIPNRLVKVAMYEHLANLHGGPPNKHHLNVYSLWSQYDWGMLVTGNVQVSPRHIGLGRDLLVPQTFNKDSVKPFRNLAKVMQAEREDKRKSLAIMQLNHTGRQSANFLGGRWFGQSPLAPSAVPIPAKKGNLLHSVVNKLLFPTPKAMDEKDLDSVVDEFVRGALLAKEAGFDGVQLHSAHGYLLTQFVSPDVNVRKDDYSSDPPANALRLLHRIITSIRAATPEDFVLGVKFNSGDYVDSSLKSAEDEVKKAQHARALSHVLTIAEWGLIDFIEVSGGNYTRPEFMNGQSTRQAFFASFSTSLMSALSSSISIPSEKKPLIVLTGGLRYPSQIHHTLNSGHSDLVGIGRAAILAPHLPALLHEHPQPQDDKEPPFAPEPIISLSSRLVPQIPLIGAGVQSAWYAVTFRGLEAHYLRHSKRRERMGDRGAEGKDEWFVPDYSLTGFGALVWMWLWIPSNETWTSSVGWIGLIITIIVAAIRQTWNK